jgi:hypothetical protein
VYVLGLSVDQDQREGDRRSSEDEGSRLETTYDESGRV